MSNKGQLLQDPFLNALRKEHVPVSIYLVNGIKLQGHVESFVFSSRGLPRGSSSQPSEQLVLSLHKKSRSGIYCFVVAGRSRSVFFIVQGFRRTSPQP